MLRLSFSVMALHLLQTCRGINTRGYSVISIRMISGVKGKKITLLKLEKSRDESHKQTAVQCCQILIRGLAQAWNRSWSTDVVGGGMTAAYCCRNGHAGCCSCKTVSLYPLCTKGRNTDLNVVQEGLHKSGVLCLYWEGHLLRFVCSYAKKHFARNWGPNSVGIRTTSAYGCSQQLSHNPMLAHYKRVNCLLA